MKLPSLRGLAPVIGPATRLVVLGSFPSEASLAAQQYYAHPRNHFWPILGALWQVDLRQLPYAERIELVRERGLGIWDVYAGCRREEKDPFSFLMFGLAEFHLGLAMSPVADASRGHFDPDLFFAALRRGAACTIDPTDGWDPWPLMHEDLAVLRARYGITP